MWRRLLNYLFPGAQRVIVQPPGQGRLTVTPRAAPVPPQSGRPVTRLSSPPKVKQPSPARRQTTLVVKPDLTRPLWRERDWVRVGQYLHGAFRTPLGSVAGLIELDRSNRPLNFYVVNPPETLLTGSHGSCFRIRPPMTRRGLKHFWVHFSSSIRGIDSGIQAVEKLCSEALAK